MHKVGCIVLNFLRVSYCLACESMLLTCPGLYSSVCRTLYYLLFLFTPTVAASLGPDAHTLIMKHHGAITVSAYID